jgi:hypothetical protein
MFNRFLLLPPKIMPFVRYVEQNNVGPDKPQMTVWRMRIAY